jgi:amidase
MKRATRETLYFEVGSDNHPTLVVEPGEEFAVETQMNHGPWLDGHPDGERLRKRLRGGNPSSGCIVVRGARPGDMLAVHVGEFILSDTGFTHFGGASGAVPAMFGPSALGELWKPVRIHDGEIIWSDALRIPIRPMLGYVGVAPGAERYANGWGGWWGGNMDVPEVTTGATVLLPVTVEGALLHVGDMHAIQGDGEICGAGGIETEGEVRLTCTIHPRLAGMDYVRIENATHVIALGMQRPAEDAFRMALEHLVCWLEEGASGARPMPRGDAFMLLAQVMEARCTQFVNPTFTYVAKVARTYLGR